MVSIALVVVAVLSLLMVTAAVAAVFATARGDSAADAALAERVALKRAARTSGDTHLFLRYPDDVADALLGELAKLGDRGRIAPAAVPAAVGLLRSALDRATDAHASYSHFHFIRCRRDGRPGKALYVAIRSRVGLETVNDSGDRQAFDRALAALAELPADAIVSAVIVEAESDRDPASPSLVTLRSAASTA